MMEPVGAVIAAGFLIAIILALVCSKEKEPPKGSSDVPWTDGEN